MSCGFAATDSSDVLFQDSSVRSYTLDFYGDPAWSSKLEAMWKEDSGYLPAKFFDGQTTLDSVGVRYKGNSSFTLAGNNPKKPFKIKFNEFKSQTYQGVKILNLSNGIGDPTMMREHIGYAIARRLLPAPRASFVHIAVEGVAIGLYTQVEQADKAYLKRWYADASGNLFKAGDDGATLEWIDANPGSYSGSGEYELKTNENAADWSGFVRFVDFLNNSSDEVFCADRGEFLDDENIAKFLAFNTVLSNFDSYNGSGRNWYAYQIDSIGAMRLIPWDLNQSFGAYGGASSALNIAIDTVQAPIADRPLFRRVLACPETREAYFNWIRAMIRGPASTDSVEAMMIRDSALIASFVASDSNKFYTGGAWNSNLRSNYRGAEGMIPGLVSFSTSRNTTIAAALDELQVGTGLARAAKGRSWSLARFGDHWQVDGLESLGSGRLDWATLDGKRLGGTAFDAGTASLSISIPTGIVALSLRSDHGSRSILVNNPRK